MYVRLLHSMFLNEFLLHFRRCEFVSLESSEPNINLERNENKNDQDHEANHHIDVEQELSKSVRRE